MAPGADLQYGLMAAYEHFFFSSHFPADSCISTVARIDADRDFTRGPNRKARAESSRGEGPHARI